MNKLGVRRATIRWGSLLCWCVGPFLLESAVEAADARSTALEALKTRYPGVRATVGADGESAVYGRPITVAAAPLKAAEAFLAEHSAIFGVTNVDLRPVQHVVLARRGATAFAYQQWMDGLPVEEGIARVLVRHGARNQVVYVAGRLVSRPPDGFAPITLNAADAVAAVRAMPAYATLPQWSAPQLVVYGGEDDLNHAVPIRAWKFEGSRPAPDNFAAYTFFVDAAAGRLAHIRDEVYYADVLGHVAGLGSPGVLPDVATNPPVELDLADLEVRSALGPTAVTDSEADYTLSNGGTAPLTIDATLSGPWVVVHNARGDDLRVERMVTPPGPGDLLFNPAPSEFDTAQVNGFIQAVSTHNFFKRYQPDFTGLDRPLDCNVNLPDTCNAFFTPQGMSLNFFGAGAGCVNTAYSTVIDHEYGHFIVNRHFLPQGAFGEGYGDCTAMLEQNDSVVGRDFHGLGTFVRDIVAADKQYPCTGEIHDCGQVLGGVWWDLKLNIEASLGAGPGLEYARQLLTDWTEITIGVRKPNSATPQTAVEVLTADDDDGDISNRTPHYDEICAAFASHSISCPGACDQISRLRVSCRSGSFTVSATVVTDLPQGDEIGLTLDGGDEQSATVGLFRRGSTRWRNVTAGDHEVCVVGCEALCQTVNCGP